jgi:hypothetical protein
MMQHAQDNTTMASSPVESSWIAIQAKSLAMQDAANTGEWVKVMEMAVERHQDLVEHFELYPVGPGNADFYRDKIGKMLESEQELQMLTLNARKHVMSAALVSNQNHRAVGAYLNTAAG